MKQTTKTLLGLGILLAVAGGIAGAALWAGKDEQKKTEAKEKSEKLFDFDKAHAKELRLSKDGQLVVRVERSEKGWRLVEPVQADGDDAAIDSLLGVLTALKQKKDLAGEKDLKAYGLDKPRLEVAVKFDSGNEQGLQVGIDNSFDNTMYVKKLGDDTVRVVDGYQKTNFEKSAFDLRDKKVAHLDDKAEIKRIDVTGARTYTLTKDGSAWKVNGQPADGPSADRIVNSMKGLRATAVAAEKAGSLKELALDKPKFTVKMSVAAGNDTYTRTVFVGQGKSGAVTQKTYARREDSPAVYEVDKTIVTDLDKDLFEFQNKELVKVDREAIRKVVFESPAGGKVEITRVKNPPPDGGFADEVFTVVAPQQGPAKKWKISSALYAVAALRATAFEGPVPGAKDLAKYGLDKPRTVTLLGEGDKVLARVRTGAEKDGKRYALSDGFEKLVRVEKSVVDDWPWTVNDALDAPAQPAASQASK